MRPRTSKTFKDTAGKGKEGEGAQSEGTERITNTANIYDLHGRGKPFRNCIKVQEASGR